MKMTKYDQEKKINKLKCNKEVCDDHDRKFKLCSCLLSVNMSFTHGETGNAQFLFLYSAPYNLF